MPYKLNMQEQFDCHRNAIDIFDYIVDFSRIDELQAPLV